MSLNPYLYFDGQCEEAFQFYEKRLGGKITFMMTWEGASMARQAPPGWAKKILHAGLYKRAAGRSGGIHFDGNAVSRREPAANAQGMWTRAWR